MSVKEVSRPEALQAMAFAPLLNFAEAAAALALPFSTLDKMHREGTGPQFIKVGKHRMITPDALRAWAEEFYDV